MRANFYMQAHHTVIWDGIPVSGFAEGDFITIKADGNAAEITKGGDGPAMNFSVPQGGELSLHLLPTSPALGTLYALRDAQKSDPRLFSVIVMTGVEEVIKAGGCGYADLPQVSTGGPTMQARQFPVKALKIDFDASAVQAVAGAFL